LAYQLSVSLAIRDGRLMQSDPKSQVRGINSKRKIGVEVGHLFFTCKKSIGVLRLSCALPSEIPHADASAQRRMKITLCLRCPQG
jgi:hypothetical protein